MISELSADYGGASRHNPLLHFRQVIPERDWQLWILINPETAFLANFQAVAEACGVPNSWKHWKAVCFPSGQQRLSWPCGLVCTLRELELLRGDGTAANSPQGHVHIQRLPCISMFYRPLLEHLPPEADGLTGFQRQSAVQEHYGIGAGPLVRLIAHYGTPADLLCRRLLDLTSAAQMALHTTLENVQNWLHWPWHAAHRHAGLQWPTPYAAIQAGYLHQVEAALGLQRRCGDQQ